ncbi:MAG: hypothetical protein ABIY55_01015 [Kofleriaceae bacterium]
MGRALSVRTRSIVTISLSGNITHSRWAYLISLGVPLYAKARGKLERAANTPSLVARIHGIVGSPHGPWVRA